MYTVALIVRYGFLVVLAVEAVLIARAFLSLMREKAMSAVTPRAEE
ncbi:MAG: hypothetical protein ACUVS4_01005 [Chloroflexaceae bacterium]